MFQYKEYIITIMIIIEIKHTKRNGILTYQRSLKINLIFPPNMLNRTMPGIKKTPAEILDKLVG